MASEPLVFISYERDSSRDLARYLHDRLQQMGANVFLDVEDIEPGANWEATLERMLIGCRYVLLLLAPETLSSEWVRREIQMALRHHKEIIPLLIRGFSFSGPAPDEAQPLLERIDDFQGIKYDHDDPTPALNKIARRLELSARPADTVPLPPSGSGHDNTQINIGKMSGGSVIGKQTNYGTAPEAQATPPTSTSKRKSVRVEVIVAVISGLFVVLAGAVAIIPALQKNQMEQQAMDATATAAQFAVLLTNTANTDQTLAAQIVASETLVPILSSSDTPSLSATTAPTNTPIPPTLIPTTPVPTHTPVPPSATSQPAPPTALTNATLRIITSPDTLTIAVLSSIPLDLRGLSLRWLDANGTVQTRLLMNDFDMLQLNDGKADAGACLVYREFGTSSPLPGICGQPNRVFRRDVTRADVFWYDFITNLPRDLVAVDGKQTIAVCPGSGTSCDVEYAGAASVLQTTTPQVVKRYPCNATVVPAGLQSNLLNVVRKQADGQADVAAAVRDKDTVTVLEDRSDNLRNTWYRIENQQGKYLGWIPSQYLQLGSACP